LPRSDDDWFTAQASVCKKALLDAQNRGTDAFSHVGRKMQRQPDDRRRHPVDPAQYREYLRQAVVEQKQLHQQGCAAKKTDEQLHERVQHRHAHHTFHRHQAGQDQCAHHRGQRHADRQRHIAKDNGHQTQHVVKIKRLHASARRRGYVKAEPFLRDRPQVRTAVQKFATEVAR
jgi:hypothetical protein